MRVINSRYETRRSRVHPGLSHLIIAYAIAIFFVAGLMMACTKTYNAAGNLSKAQYDSLLLKLAPYVVKKPDEFSYDERFDIRNRPYYKNFISTSGAGIQYYHENDTAAFFFFRYRDLSSLYEHYRGIGGYLSRDASGNIIFLDLLFHTPRFTLSQMNNRSEILFEEMVVRGNVLKFLGNRSFIETPNADFFYDTELHRWNHRRNSSWKFLDDGKQARTGKQP
jgi:hypothetical protein